MVFLFFAQLTPAQAKPTTTPATTEPVTFTPEIAIPGLFSGETIITGTTILSYVRAIFILFIWSVGILAVVMVIYGGIKWVAAAGNPGRINDARDVVNNAVIGVIIALTSIVLLNTINPNLVDIRGIMPGYVRDQASEETTAHPFKGGVTLVSGDYQTIAKRVRARPEWIAAIKNNSTTQVPAERILAILFIESAGKENAKSSANAYGLMQLLPATANEFGVRSEDLFDGVKNIGGGARYLQSLAQITCPAETSRRRCTSGRPCINGDWRFINAAYNGGRAANSCSQSCPGQTWSQCIDNEGYAETRNYINKAEDAYQWIVKNNFFAS